MVPPDDDDDHTPTTPTCKSDTKPSTRQMPSPRAAADHSPPQHGGATAQPCAGRARSKGCIPPCAADTRSSGGGPSYNRGNSVSLACSWSANRPRPRRRLLKAAKPAGAIPNAHPRQRRRRWARRARQARQAQWPKWGAESRDMRTTRGSKVRVFVSIVLSCCAHARGGQGSSYS